MCLLSCLSLFCFVLVHSHDIYRRSVTIILLIIDLAAKETRGILLR